MLHSLHAISSFSLAHNIGTTTPCQATHHFIAFHFLHLLLGTFLCIGRVPFRRIFFSTALVCYSLLRLYPSNIATPFSHRTSERPGTFLPFLLVFIYIPVIFAQLSVGVPSSHRFADFLPRQQVFLHTLRGLG